MRRARFGRGIGARCQGRSRCDMPISEESNTMAKVVRVAVTGAAGQVAYAMLGRLASGAVFGPDTKVILQLLEITPALPALEGVAMELDDCSFPALQEMVLTDDPNRAFKDVNYALLVGSFPRKAGMEP